MKKIVCSLLVVILIFLTGCIEKKIPQSIFTDSSPKEIIYNLGKLPEDLIMLSKDDVRQRDLLILLFEGLIKKNEKGNIVPAIAEKWIISKDELTYTFKLREDAYWSDGKNITAEDFVKFFYSLLDPKLKNIYVSELYCIFGAKEVNEGKKSNEGLAVMALDSNTLEIRLNSTCSSFLDILSEPIFFLRKFDDNLVSWNKNYKDVLYTGPFRLNNISDNEELTLIKNNTYFDRVDVKSEGITVTAYDSSEAALAAFKTSKINIMVDPPLSESKDLVSDGDAVTFPIDNGANLCFNLKKTESNTDISLRKAISSSLNRELLISEDLGFFARSADAFVPYVKGEEKYNISEDNLFHLNSEKALSYLKDSKFDRNSRLKLVYLNSLENRKLCEGIAKNIKDLLDVNVDCKGYEQEELMAVIKAGKYDMLEWKYASTADSPINFLEQFTSGSFTNVFGYENQEYDSTVVKAKLEKDASQRKNLISKAIVILGNELPVIPIYFQNIMLCKRQNIEGIYITKEGNVKLEKAFINNTTD